MPKPFARAIRGVRDRFDRNPALAVPPVLRNEVKILGWISDLTGEPTGTVRHRLREEYNDFGINVCRAMDEAGLEPFVWSDELIRFYEQTDSFLYELVTWNLNRLKAWMRHNVAQLLESDGPGPYDVLSIGDGVGVDSAHLASRGHRVTYHEVSGYTEAFARRVFADRGVDVRVVVDEADVPDEAFDAVVCLDVLEHLPDPPVLVRKIARHLRPGGRLFVNAPFMWIHRSNPTHIRASRRYSGSLSIYRREGLILDDGAWAWNPLSLRKTPGPGGDARTTGGDAQSTGGDAQSTGGDVQSTGGDAWSTAGDVRTTAGDARSDGGNARAAGGKGRAGGDGAAVDAARGPIGRREHRIGAALNRMVIRGAGVVMLTGRVATLPFLWGDDLRLIEARWFPEPAAE